jgi:hypothetical protein
MQWRFFFQKGCGYIQVSEPLIIFMSLYQVSIYIFVNIVAVYTNDIPEIDIMKSIFLAQVEQNGFGCHCTNGFYFVACFVCGLMVIERHIARMTMSYEQWFYCFFRNGKKKFLGFQIMAL